MPAFGSIPANQNVELGPLIQSGVHSATTNAQGFISFPFPIAFAATPQCFITYALDGFAYFNLFPGSTGPTQAAFICRGDNGLIVPNAPVTVHWLAVGVRA